MSKELPILFNTQMVKAILDGEKTSTRRIIKSINTDIETLKKACQYQPGDILYVRETWEHFECWNCEGDERGNCPKEPQKNVLDKICGCYMYRATDEIRGDAKWHPSIHMPKKAARIWLKVTNVSVEHLKDITAEDALREGAGKYIYLNGELDKNAVITSFIGIWDNTVDKSDIHIYGWNANPLVYVIDFEVITKPENL